MEENKMNCKAELIDRISVLLSELGTDAQRSKYRLAMILDDYEITQAEKALTVYHEMRNEALIRRFIASKAVAGCTQRTLHRYDTGIRYALTFIGKNADEISSDDLLVFFAKRLNMNLSKVTVNNDRLVLSSFFTFLMKDEIISKNPMLRIEKIKSPAEKKKAFSDMDIERLRQKLRTERERAIFELLLSTGCRVSELVSIKKEDISDDAIRILGKGQKYRTVYVNAKAALAIESYLAERKDANPYLFPKCTGFSVGVSRARYDWYKNPTLICDEGPQDKGSIESFCRRLGKQAGVSDCHPHRFRRTCATFALRKGMPIELVSKMLGHANIGTTQIYLDIAEDDLKQAHRKYVSQ